MKHFYDDPFLKLMYQRAEELGELLKKLGLSFTLPLSYSDKVYLLDLDGNKYHLTCWAGPLRDRLGRPIQDPEFGLEAKIFDEYEFTKLEELFEIEPLYELANQIADEFGLRLAEKIMHGKRLDVYWLNDMYSCKYTLVLQKVNPTSEDVKVYLDAILEFDKRRRLIDGGT